MFTQLLVNIADIHFTVWTEVTQQTQENPIFDLLSQNETLTLKITWIIGGKTKWISFITLYVHQKGVKLINTVNTDEHTNTKVHKCHLFETKSYDGSCFFLPPPHLRSEAYFKQLCMAVKTSCSCSPSFNFVFIALSVM